MAGQRGKGSRAAFGPPTYNPGSADEEARHYQEALLKPFTLEACRETGTRVTQVFVGLSDSDVHIGDRPGFCNAIATGRRSRTEGATKKTLPGGGIQTPKLDAQGKQIDAKLGQASPRARLAEGRLCPVLPPRYNRSFSDRCGS